MSDPVANSIIGGIVTVILGAFQLIGIYISKQTKSKVDKLEQHTNGMQQRLEELAHSSGVTQGVQEEKDRREQP